MIATLFMAIAIVATVIIMIPGKWRRRIAGYTLLADITASWYIITTYASTAAVSGLAIAVFAALGMTITLRGMAWLLGTERLSLNGSTDTREIVAGLMSQTMAWGNAVFKALWNRTFKVTPPPALEWAWVEITESAIKPGWLGELIARVVTSVQTSTSKALAA
jgi:hypothetical protein